MSLLSYQQYDVFLLVSNDFHFYCHFQLHHASKLAKSDRHAKVTSIGMAVWKLKGDGDGGRGRGEQKLCVNIEMCL